MTSISPALSPATKALLVVIHTNRVGTQQSLDLRSIGILLVIRDLRACREPGTMLSVGEVAQASGLTKSAVSRAAGRLVRGGLLLSNPQIDDARKVNLRITHKALALILALPLP